MADVLTIKMRFRIAANEFYCNLAFGLTATFNALQRQPDDGATIYSAISFYSYVRVCSSMLE